MVLCSGNFMTPKCLAPGVTVTIEDDHPSSYAFAIVAWLHQMPSDAVNGTSAILICLD